MPTLAGIDTTKVYHDGFDSEQLKDLRMEQYYVHIDVITWFEEMLTNKYREFNCIKIIYERLYHYDINYVKCVEIYYDVHDLERFRGFKSDMDRLVKDVRFKMPWRSNSIYYVHSEPRVLSDIEEQLREEDLHNFLIKQYKMDVDWCTKHNLTVYEFKPTLNGDLLEYIDWMFLELFADHPIFISDAIMFLKNTEPPQYKEVKNISVLTVFHGQLLSCLTIEDILSLELANKDHRFETYNSVLDRDIQVHLQNRLNLFNKHTKLDKYVATKFTNLELLKYFTYKYGDRFIGGRMKNKILTSDNFDDVLDELRSLKIIPLSNSAMRFDIISPENITVCSITLLRHKGGHLIQPDSIKIKEIRLDSDISVSLYDEDIVEIGHPPYFIEITIRAKCKSVRLSHFLHTVLEKISSFHYDYNSIIQLRSYNNRINSCIRNSFVKRAYQFEVGFKNIIFDFKRLVKWLSKCSRLNSVSFSECIFMLSEKPTTMLEIIMKQKKISELNLTFRNMKCDILTISILLHICESDIVCDGCTVVPSSSAIIQPKSLKTIAFANMNIVWQVLIPLLPYVSVAFADCQIQSKHEEILQLDSMAKLSLDHMATFEHMDIDAEVLLNISVYIPRMKLNCCRILSNETGNKPFYSLTTNDRINMDNLEIETNVAAEIFKKFNVVNFTNSRFVCTDLSTAKIPTKSNSKLNFVDISITHEFIKGLKYIDFGNTISFLDCSITNRNLVEIWSAAPRCKRISVEKPHLVDFYFYFELVAKIYENRLDEMLHELKDGVAIPFIDLFDIEWNKNPLDGRDIDWRSIKIRSVLVNDGTVKFEYLRNGEVLDIFYEQNNLLNDSDVCQVNYY